ncbi:hypothetical protein C7974DRAFT_411285 [Boeremia exigua]|uniref:uncharacterized protein n=1 Tax=Boeremia exigua TaxID=749465 RepID=UPI001E8CEE6E|nr:uncharacterized protein C7974DRAFT_411285 [Boeremia exigua]KAH6637823.1 hypothetical protein C7974DRAFT_411285 [Boeremia exigua]
MSETIILTKETVVKGNNAQARIFLVGVDTQKADAGPKPIDPMAVFILNSKDFIDLQKYIQAATALPSSAALFEAEFPRSGMSKFLEEDPELYDAMKEALPRMHQRCANFQIETLEPMIVLGGRISNFAKSSGTYIDRIVGYLNKMGEPGVSKNSPAYSSAKRNADKHLDRLIAHAGEVGVQCGEVFDRLSAFKVKTTTEDKTDLDMICRRLRKIMPDEAAKNSRVQKLIDNAKTLVNQAKQMVDDQLNEAREKGKAKWYHYIPVIGTIILIVDRVKQNGLMNTLRELNDKYVLARKQSENQIEQITATSNQLDTLFSELKGVEDTIQNAMDAVGKMQKTFSKLQTMFEHIKKKLEGVNSDIDDEYISDYIVQVEDLQDAAETWERVARLADVFQNTGLVLDIKLAPAEVIEEEGGTGDA